MKEIDKAQKGAKEYIGLALMLAGFLTILNNLINLNLSYLKEVNIFIGIIVLIIGLYLSGFVKAANDLSNMTRK